MKLDTQTISIKINRPVDTRLMELNAYRSIGPVSYFKYLKQQEIRRRRRARKIRGIVLNTMFWSLFSFDIWVVMSCLGIICHESPFNFINLVF